MRKLLALMVAVLLIAGFAATALAWEFEMKGEWENRIRYFSRTGNNDLFGIATLQEGPTAAAFATGAANAIPGAGVTAAYVGFAGPWTWARGALLPAGGTVNAAAGVTGPTTNADNAGMGITRGGFSTWQSDAAIHDQKLTLIPTIKVNPAIRVHGVYTVGGYRNKYNQTAGGVGVPPFERWYMHDSSPNAAYNTAGIGSWEQMRATFHTPWATFSIGIKDFPLGTASNLAYNTRANAFLAVVPYGPFRFLGAVWLTDGGAESYAMSPDSGFMNQLFQGYFTTYRNGPTEIGCGVIWQLAHRNIGAGPVGGIPGTSTITDVALLQKILYMKYFNGRFFFNAEYMWNNIDLYPALLGPVVAAGGNNNGATQQYQELYNWFVETGVVVGPSKISLVWAQTAGPVLNNGSVVVPGVFGQVGAGLNPKRYTATAINYQAMEPYEYLMFYTYGGGNQSFNADGTGQMTDAYAFAGRYDYAVASNLNIYGTYIWAHRLEKFGTWFGQFASSGQNVGAGGGAFVNALALRGLYGGTSPFAEDGFIGWEANLGCDWKLLEGLTFKTRYAYWQPGEYFKEAWRAVGVRAGAVVNNAMFLDRDAIQAIQGSILIEF